MQQLHNSTLRGIEGSQALSDDLFLFDTSLYKFWLDQRRIAAIAIFIDVRSVEEKEIVEQGLASLSPAQRRIMELLHFEGHTLREISQLEGKELGAIRNSYYRGLKALKTVLSVGVRRTTVGTTISAKRREEYEIEL